MNEDTDTTRQDSKAAAPISLEELAAVVQRELAYNCWKATEIKLEEEFPGILELLRTP